MQKEQRIDAEPIYLRYNSNTHIAIPLNEYDALKQKEKALEKTNRRLRAVFPAWHREMRKKYNLSQTEFSKVMCITRRMVAYYEAGEFMPDDIEAYIHETELMLLVHLEKELKMKRGVVFGDKLRGPKRG